MRAGTERALALAGVAGAAAVVLKSGAVVRDRQWRDTTDGLMERLLEASRPPAPTVVSFAALAGLPPPVGRYLRRVLNDGQPLIRTARLSQAGEFRVGGAEAGWRPLRATQWFTTEPVGFLWDARIELLPGLAVRVRDGYVGGAGLMRASAAALVTLVDQRDRPELNAGALQRLLAEAAWVPTLLLPGPGLRWAPIDERSARATMTDGATTASLEFRFDEAGDIAGVYTPGRFREVNGRYETAPWGGVFGRYATVGGVRIPAEFDVRWELPGGDLHYDRGRIEDAAYSFVDPADGDAAPAERPDLGLAG